MSIPTRRSTRPGFTLVELLFVLAIIVVLVALSAAAILKFIDVGPYSATVANMTKIKAAIDTQWKAIRDKTDKEALPTDTAQVAWLKTRAGLPASASLADPRLRELYVQLKLAQAFPTSFTEALNPCGVANPAAPDVPVKPWSGYANYLATLNVNLTNAASAATPERQQAICLLMILEHGPSHTGLSADALGISAVQRFDVLTTNAFGCADAWGRPLLFTNRLQGPAPAAMVPAIRSLGKDGKDGGVWNPNPDNNDDISTVNY